EWYGRVASPAIVDYCFCLIFADILFYLWHKMWNVMWRNVPAYFIRSRRRENRKFVIPQPGVSFHT
ncbi:hypothetical protein, partial [Phyllobacterium sp. YR620]|uniref:hypothetical protein n=1 Tax=Phyllobacterium sp. YR620 TaxID=1881066 RepID=UPI001AED10E1